MAAIGFAAAVNSVYGALWGHTVPGWSSLMAAIGLLTGTQFLMLGIIGAYLGRLYDQSKGTAAVHDPRHGGRHRHIGRGHRVS